MYIMINDVIGKKTIDLSYPIYPNARRGEAKKEIAVVSMFSNKSQILLQKSMEVLLYMGKKIVLDKGVYTDKELDSLIGTELKSQMLEFSNDVQRTNKLKKIMKVAISLNELDKSGNLENGRPRNTLFTYYVTNLEYCIHFEPRNPRYKALKYAEIVSLTLKITDQNNNIITDELGTTVVLHIR